LSPVLLALHLLSLLVLIAFEFVQFGRHFGRDFETSQLVLNCVRNIDNDPKVGRQDATTIEIQLAKDTLLQILMLFADTKSISKRYKLTAKAGEDLLEYSTGDIERPGNTASKEGSTLEDCPLGSLSQV
jgi:hypothetical protein